MKHFRIDFIKSHLIGSNSQKVDYKESMSLFDVIQDSKRDCKTLNFDYFNIYEIKESFGGIDENGFEIILRDCKLVYEYFK